MPQPGFEAWLPAIVAQRCPICAADNFAVIALHMYQAHGIRAVELRKRLGLGSADSIVSLDYHNRRTLIAAEQFAASPLVDQNASAHLERRERDKRLIDLLEQGASFSQVAEALGLTISTVYHSADRLGLRLTDHKQRNRESYLPVLDRGRQTQIAKAEARLSQIRRRLESGESKKEIAESMGIRRRSLDDILSGRTSRKKISDVTSARAALDRAHQLASHLYLADGVSS